MIFFSKNQQSHRYKGLIEYNGSSYFGMQKQKYTDNTIESKIEIALKKLCQKDIKIGYSGRTDAGVHAIQQVIHFDLKDERFDAKNILFGLNFYLKSENIVILKIEKAKQNFHARFDAKKRTYKYSIINREIPSILHKNDKYFVQRKLNIKMMKKVAKILQGKHDFSAFCHSECNRNKIRTICNIKIIRNHENIDIFISAKSFLHNMVRIIIGTMIDVVLEKITLEDFKKSFKEGKRIGHTAPPHALFFVKTKY